MEQKKYGLTLLVYLVLDYNILVEHLLVYMHLKEEVFFCKINGEMVMYKHTNTQWHTKYSYVYDSTTTIRWWRYAGIFYKSGNHARDYWNRSFYA